MSENYLWLLLGRICGETIGLIRCRTAEKPPNLPKESGLIISNPLTGHVEV